MGFIEKRHDMMENIAEKVTLSEVPICSLEGNGDHDGEGDWTKPTVNFDTGAAVTAIPQWLADGKLVEGDRQSSSVTYRAASAELLEDQSGVQARGSDDQGRGRSINGRLVNVRQTLVSGTAVTKRNLVMLDGDHGVIIPRHSVIAKEINKRLKKLMTSRRCT